MGSTESDYESRLKVQERQTSKQTYTQRVQKALEIDRIKVDGNWVTQQQLKAHLYELMYSEEPSEKHFIRWAGSIRYYVEGLEEHPEAYQYFNQLILEIRKLTGIAIRPHDKIYWPLQGTSHHPDAPDSMFTNVVLIFSDDFERSFESESVVKAYELLRVDLDEQRKLWRLNKKERGVVDLSRSSAGKRGEIYLHVLLDISETESVKIRIKNKVLATVYYLMLRDKRNRYSNQIRRSLTNRDSKQTRIYELNQFDKALLAAYYSKSVQLLLPKDEAIKRIFSVMWLNFVVEQESRVEEKKYD